MPTYKLTYFNSKGRAEATRLVFAAAGVPYEDCRVDGAGFQKLKASGKLPFGQLPILEVDGKVLGQSNSIFKYVARETGFAPSDSYGLAVADMIVDGVVDVMSKVMKFAFEKDEETKKTLAKPFYEKDLPVALAYFEQILKSNGGKYFVGDKMTYADVMFCGSVDVLFLERKEDVPSALNGFPLLKDLFSSFLSNPGIKEWLSKRPTTPM